MSCGVTRPHLSAVVPPGLQAMYGILWSHADAHAPAEGVLEDAIAAHVNVLATAHATSDPVTNSLFHFADLKEGAHLEALGRVLEAARARGVSLVVTFVLPNGAFRHRRGELEMKLGALAGSFSGPLHLTEDYAGGWTRTFAVQSRPSTYLIDARGAFVWKQEGVLDIKALAAALEHHTIPAPAPRSTLLHLTIQPGERIPEAEFEDDTGRVLALRRMRGRAILLNFWQSWSAPCIKELLRLQRLQEKGGERAPVIVAVNGGESPEVLAKVRQQHQLTFSLAQDAGQRIAQFFGVHCWPTTVSINPDGMVDRMQFGAAHTHRAENRGKQTT